MGRRREPFIFQKIDNLKPRDKPWKYSGEKGSGNKGGLYVLVTPAGGRLWRMEYRNPKNGKRRTLSFGAFPIVSITEAMQKRDDAKRLIAQGIDPRDAEREAHEQQRMQAQANATTFRTLAEIWLARCQTEWAASTALRYRRALENTVLPELGDLPIAQVTTQAVAMVLDKQKDAGRIPAARRALALIRAILDFAVDEGWIGANPALARRWRFGRTQTKSFPALTRAGEIGEFLARVDEIRARHPRTSPATIMLLRLSPYLFLRPAELRETKWNEVDLETARITIPATRMKTREAHIVPLSRQVLSLLKEWREIDPDAVFVFPSIVEGKALSHNAIHETLKKMGYAGKVTAHGFRAMARTVLQEQLHFDPDVIEKQLAHRVPDRLGTAYNRTQHLEERIRMMQAWADFLDKLKADAQQQQEKGGNDEREN